MAKKLTDTAKKAKSAKKSGTTKKKTTKRTKISWIVKPDGMSLMEWQIALRKQIAQEEQGHKPQDGQIKGCKDNADSPCGKYNLLFSCHLLNSLSLIYEDLILGDRLMVDDFRGKLNRYCLFSIRKDAERFLETISECPDLRGKYNGVVEKASVVKVFIHRMCLPAPVLSGVVLKTETLTRLTIKSDADTIEWLRRQLSVEHDLEGRWEKSDLTNEDLCRGISYDSRLGVEADTDEQIKDVLSCLTSDGIAALKSSHGLKTAVHVAIHGDFNPAIYISPETIRALAQFKAGLDITASKDHIKKNI